MFDGNSANVKASSITDCKLGRIKNNGAQGQLNLGARDLATTAR